MAQVRSQDYVILYVRLLSLLYYVILLHTNYPCPCCHTNFINQEEVIDNIEIGSGTDSEPEVLNLIRPFYLHNLSQQHQQAERANWSNEHISMKRL